jgi:hypothetical protein
MLPFTLRVPRRAAGRLLGLGLVLLFGAMVVGPGSATTNTVLAPTPSVSVVVRPPTKPIPPDPPVFVTQTSPPRISATSAAPQAPAPPRPTARVLTAADTEALGYVDFHWDVFMQALQTTNGTKLTAAQLAKPPIVVVDKASCSQPGSNLLGPKSRKALTYCAGQLELVSDVFLTITEPGQRKVVASAFIYHALDHTPAAMRKKMSGVVRNDIQVIGCVQASLSYALVRYQAITDATEAWAVMREGTTGGDLHNSYYATIENHGQWQ